MRTFDATVRGSWFWGTAFAPPVLFFGLVQWWGGDSLGPVVEWSQIFALLALSQGLPVAALGWTLCSVAGYSIGGGRLVVHRVVGDREYKLDQLDGPPRIAQGAVTLAFKGHRVHVRVADPASCLAVLRESAGLREV